MTPKELIESGNLEMYVAGTLNEQDAHLVYESMQSFPEVRNEVQRIEAAIIAALENESEFPSASVKEKLLAELNLKATDLKPIAAPKKKYFWQFLRHKSL